MTEPYRGNDDRRLSGDGEVDENAEREAEEHAEVMRREEPDVIAADAEEEPPD